MHQNNVKGFQKQQKSDINSLWNSYHQRLLDFVSYLTKSNYNLSTEVVQLSFIKILNKKIDTTRSPWSYLKTVAKNTLIDLIRKEKRAVDGLELTEMMKSNSLSPEDEYIINERLHEIWKEVHQLPISENSKDILAQRIEGKSYEEISQSGHCLGTVASALTRLRRKLKKSLRQR